MAEGNGLLLLSPELLNSLSFNTADVKRTHRRFYFGPYSKHYCQKMDRADQALEENTYSTTAAPRVTLYS